jgi:hypothetical protein
MIDTSFSLIGYQFDPSRYSPGLGYSRLRIAISGQPTQRLFDVKTLYVPTFDGRFYHQTRVSRHELALDEIFKVCIGQMSAETYQGESLRAFSFGGTLRNSIHEGELYCELISTAPIFKLQENPIEVGGVVADEIVDLLAENQTKLVGHGDELYSRLAKYDPYQVFLASIVSLQKRSESIPANLRRANYRKVVSAIQEAIKTIRNTDGWNGQSLSLEELLAS